MKALGERFRPNVVLIVMDDLAWGDLASHGNPFVRTPNLDRLHDESVRLTRYCSGPLCTPARASLMTGRYHLRTRAIDTYCGRSMMDPDEVTLPSVLKNAGYRTGAFGKWHLGDCRPMRPCDRGFDESVVFGSGGIGWPGDHIENYVRGASSYFDPVLQHNGLPTRYQGYCTDIFTDEAISFIEANRADPFLVYLATNAPHTPLEVAEEWIEPYRNQGINETHARLYGMVENIDWNVGRLLGRLRELDLADDTIVIYTSDHGPCPTARDVTAPPEKQQRYNAGLRGEKGSLYEGGIRVPFFWRWPGHSPAGVDIDRIASPIDVLPTLASAVGVERPPSDVDGRDLLALINGEVTAETWPERAIYMQWHRGDAPSRYRNYAVITQQYKLYQPGSSAEMMAGPTPTDEPVSVGPVEELYDLAADPFETTNLAASMPQLVNELRERYEKWFDDVSATRPDNYAAPRIALPMSVGEQVTLSRQDWRVGNVRDGFNPKLDAHWEVVLDTDGLFDVVVHMDPPLVGLEGVEWSRGTVHVAIGENVFGKPAVLWCGDYGFSGIEVRAGRFTVRAWAQGDTEREMAAYVDITRIDADGTEAHRPATSVGGRHG